MLAYKHDSESGFTLVELLVVIAIIAILTAIAVPAFLNQRKKANDAAVRSDMKNVVTEIETESIDASGDAVITVEYHGLPRVNLTISGANPVFKFVPISKDVVIVTPSNGNVSGYRLSGYHKNGHKYKPSTDGSPHSYLRYDSASGGFIN